MDKLWKWVMHLNAKAFCLGAVLLFVATAVWCAFMYLTPPKPFQDGGEAAKQEMSPTAELGTLNFVSNQLTSESLTIPVDPFRPTIEAIFTNETERAAFLKALKAAQNAAAGIESAAGSSKKEDPFAHLRRKPEGGGLTDSSGQPMVIPKLTFIGFFQRPDGTKASMFHDSSNDSTVFYDAGKKVHGVDMVDADVHEAEIRFPDGTTRKLAIGGSVELAAEPDKNPPPPKKSAGAKPGAAAGAAKGGAPQQKPGVKPGVKPGAQQPKQGPNKPQPQKPAPKAQKPDQ